jgi:hypothetical protein
MNSFMPCPRLQSRNHNTLCGVGVVTRSRIEADFVVRSVAGSAMSAAGGS